MVKVININEFDPKLSKKVLEILRQSEEESLKRARPRISIPPFSFRTFLLLAPIFTLFPSPIATMTILSVGTFFGLMMLGGRK